MNDDRDAERVPQQEKKKKSSNDSLKSPSRDQAKITNYFSSPSSKVAIQQTETMDQGSRTNCTSKKGSEFGSRVSSLESAKDTNLTVAGVAKTKHTAEQSTGTNPTSLDAAKERNDNSTTSKPSNQSTSPTSTGTSNDCAAVNQDNIIHAPRQKSLSHISNPNQRNDNATTKRSSRSSSPDCAAVDLKNIIHAPRRRSRSPISYPKQSVNDNSKKRRSSRSTSPDYAAVDLKNIVHAPRRRRSRSPVNNPNQRNDNTKATRRRSRSTSPDCAAVDLKNIIHAGSRARSRRKSNRVRPTTDTPSSPKQPMSAYDFFKVDVLPKYKKDHPNLSKNQLEQKVEQEWTLRNSKIPHKYKCMEEDDKVRYELEVHHYKSILEDANISKKELLVPQQLGTTEGKATGLTPPPVAAAAAAFTATTRALDVSAGTTPSKVARPKRRSQGSQTTMEPTSSIPKESTPPTPPTHLLSPEAPITSVKNLWKPSQFQNKKRFQVLEHHRKVRRQRMAGRRKGLLVKEDSADKEATDKEVSTDKKSADKKSIDKKSIDKEVSTDKDDFCIAHSDDWEVDKILGTREYFQEHELLVKWKGKDASWNSWETIASIELRLNGEDSTMGNFWEQVRIFVEKDQKRKMLMKTGAMEMGLLDEQGKESSLVEGLHEIPLEEHLAKSKARTNPVETATTMQSSKSKEQETTNSTVPEEPKQAAETTLMELDKQPDKSCLNKDAETTAASASTSDQPDVVAAATPTNEPAISLQASNLNEQETTDSNTAAKEAKQAAETTMMELDTQPDKSSPIEDAETTPASAHSPMNLYTQPDFYSQPNLYTQPEPSFNDDNIIETTTVSTMTLAVGRMPNGDTANPFAAIVGGPNVQEGGGGGGGSSEVATNSETETETTEPTAGSATTDDTKNTPLRTLSMATFGHRECEWSEEPSPTAANKASNTTGTTAPAEAAANETNTNEVAVPVNIEAKAGSKTSDGREIIVLLGSSDEETEDETPTTKNASTVVAKVATPALKSADSLKEDETTVASSSAANGVATTGTMEQNSTPMAVDKSESNDHGHGISNPDQEGTPCCSLKQPSTKPQEPITKDTDDVAVTGVRGASDRNHPKRPIMNGVQPKHHKRRRTLQEEKQCEDVRSPLFQVPSAHDMNIRDVPRVHAGDVDAKQIVTEAREKGHPIVLTNLLGHPQFATRWLKRWNDKKRDPGDDDFFVDGDPHSYQHEELLDLSQRHELDIERMIEDIGEESVPILKKNYSETKPIVKHTFAANFLRKCWPRNGRHPQIKGLYLHQWQFPRSETAASKLCGHGNCTVIPNGIVGEDLLQFWLDGEANPYQYIFMGGADTFSKLHKDSGGLDITIAPIVGKKECVMVHRDDQRYLYGMKSKPDNPNLDKYPMTAHARVWKTVVKPGELLWMPAGTFHQCRNVTPCLSYHRLHLDTINLQLFFNSLFVGDALEIQHDEVIWNCTIELIERIEKFLEDYRQQPNEPVPKHIAETATTLSYLRPLCREIAVAFDSSCKQIHLIPKNKRLRSEQAVGSRVWPRLVEDIDLTLHDFNHRMWVEVPPYQTQAAKSVPKQTAMADREEIKRGLNLLQDSSFMNKEHVATGTSALQKLYDKLSAIQPFQEGLVISDSIQLKNSDKIIFRIGEKQCPGRIATIKDQLKTAYLTYSRLPSYYDEYVPVANVTSEQSLAGSPLQKKQMVSSAIGGKGKLVKATVQSIKVATFYLVRFSMDAKQSAKHERWLCRDLIISKDS